MRKHINFRTLTLCLSLPLIAFASIEASAQSKKKVAKPSSLIDEKKNIVKRRLLVDERQFENDMPRVHLPVALENFQAPKMPAEVPLLDFSMIVPDVKNLPQSPKVEAASLPKKTPSIPSLKPEPRFNFEQPEDQLVKVDTFSADEVQLFEAYVILEDRKQPLQAYGTFASLMTQKSEIKESARWGFAHAALGVGLRIQYETKMMEFVNSDNKFWQDRAIKSLISNSNADKSFWVQMLGEDKFEALQDTEATDDYLVLKAHRLASSGKVKDAIAILASISKQSKLYGVKTYHEALLTYRQGGLLESMAVLENGMKENPSAFGDSAISAKSRILLGRLAFQNREFSKAFEAYRSVPKSNPMWPEAMMEQALSQILYQDFEGAAGNMFSLHTDFFKKSYSPDSYIIRSVGYLNLCQYADAQQVVQDLQRKYRPILASLDRYAKAASTIDDFETIRRFAKDPSVSQVNGLPRPFIFFWAQDPNFERHQTRINQIEDEMDTYRKLSLEAVKNERDAAKQVADLSASLRSLKSNGASESKVETVAQNLESAKSTFKGLSESRKALTKMRGEFTAKMESLKAERKTLALKALNERRKTLHAGLKEVIDQSEVLLYEVYSGAGENLRYQAAGGELETRKTAALSGANDKATNWKFKGEIWEDELGHFRSNLHSVCAKDSI